MENYFNYFTEIEECFRRCRGTPTLLSTLDWALIESWKESDFPLSAVLTGADVVARQRRVAVIEIPVAQRADGPQVQIGLDRPGPAE